MSVTLEDLCGEHLLSGVDFPSVEMERYGEPQTCNACRFRLDGKTYTAVENPSDGYRSSMEDLLVGDEDVTNEWAPLRVLASMDRTRRYGNSNDTLELRDLVTGEIVLRVGTDNSDYYYPSFVSEFSPENMAHNAGRK